MSESSNDIVQRYLEDVIAAERSFESQLRTMADEGDYAPAKQLFAAHAEQTKIQHERLTERLEQIGGSAPALKTAIAHVFNFAPKAAQLGHHKSEKSAQDLIIAFTIENSEVATYEALATVAASAGDWETERLAREIQQQERDASHNIWHLIADSSRSAYYKLVAA